MAEFVDELMDYLATLTGLVAGANLFAQFKPDHDGLVMAVMDTGGSENPPHDKWRLPSVQVLIEGPGDGAGYNASAALAYTVHDDLTACSNLDLTTWRIEYLHAIQQPYCHGKNGKGKWWWTFNFNGRIKKR